MKPASVTLVLVLPFAFAFGAQAGIPTKEVDIPYVKDGTPRQCLDLYLPAGKPWRASCGL